MSPKEKEEFVVADRRKFTPEGELRTEPSPEPPQEVAAEQSASVAEPAEAAAEPVMPEPPSAAEQAAQNKDYQDAGKKIDSILEGQAQGAPQVEVNFERLIVSLYMQAMAQLGMIREEGTEPHPDIVGARQTIDTIALLGEKTKGNITERETSMLQNCLFELRMAFLEITNVFTRPRVDQPPKAKG